ncbi:hypothetical protein [Streptomyces roseoviridis]|uniref:Uncharacterized protein n=1 Tax=Streptomyces roseoviridis TaxID=67361 RepID=A0ABV5QIW9_9ACTN
MTHSGQGPEPQYPAAQPLPPEVTPGGPSDAQATQYLPPVPAQPPAAPPAGPPGYGYPQAAQGGYGYPGPDAQATQYIAPVAPQAPQAPDAQATQYLPPVAPQGPQAPQAPDAQATQYLPPVTGGPDAQATQYLPPVQQQGPAQPPAPQPAQPPAPQAGYGERPPLADFDNLFRSDTPAPRPAAAPQPGYGYPQPPQPQHRQPPQPQHHQPPQPPQYGGGFQDAYYDDEPEPPRRKSPVALIAAVVAGCAVVGLGAGALLSGGDEKDDPAGKAGQNVAASSAAPPSTASEKPADPAEAQAKALDKLLADSNDSRDAVIRSVEAIKSCKNLDQAAADLRGAAEQRRGLVTRLQSLSVDQLPDSTALTEALTKAWQASASADDHYAAWAEQAKNKKICKGGKARSTSQTIEANKKSGEATTEKRKAAALWNPTAEKYGLEKRSPTQL